MPLSAEQVTQYHRDGYICPVPRRRGPRPAAWVAVEDDYARDPALTLEGTSVRMFPLASISKRVERGEEVDVYALLEEACGAIERLRGEGV